MNKMCKWLSLWLVLVLLLSLCACGKKEAEEEDEDDAPTAATYPTENWTLQVDWRAVSESGALGSPQDGGVAGALADLCRSKAPLVMDTNVSFSVDNEFVLDVDNMVRFAQGTINAINMTSFTVGEETVAALWDPIGDMNDLRYCWRSNTLSIWNADKGEDTAIRFSCRRDEQIVTVTAVTIDGRTTSLAKGVVTFTKSDAPPTVEATALLVD